MQQEQVAEHERLVALIGSEGPTAYEKTLTQENEGLTWRMRSNTTRFTGIFSQDGSVITGHWEFCRMARTGSPGWTSP